MDYTPETVEWLRSALAEIELQPGEERGETKRFGGLCFTLNGKMWVGIGKTGLAIRIGDEAMAKGLESGKTRPMDLTGKPLKNFAFLDEAAWLDKESLRPWALESASFVRTYMLAKPEKKKNR